MLLQTKATLILLLTASASLQAAPLNGLYFGLDNMRGFAEVYWWFLPDGRVLRDTLPTGLTIDKFDAACRQHSGFCGNHTLNGDKLTLQYKTGNSETWSYKPLNGGIQLNYLILTPVEKYPAGARLSGSWDRTFAANVHSSPGSNTTITSPTFYTFTWHLHLSQRDGDRGHIEGVGREHHQFSARLNLPEHMPLTTTP